MGDGSPSLEATDRRLMLRVASVPTDKAGRARPNADRLLILGTAHLIHDDLARRGYRAWMHGRMARPLVDPGADPAGWIARGG